MTDGARQAEHLAPLGLDALQRIAARCHGRQSGPERRPQHAGPPQRRQLEAVVADRRLGGGDRARPLRRDAHAVHEHVAPDHVRLAQVLAHPLAAAHGDQCGRQQEDRREAAVGVRRHVGDRDGQEQRRERRDDHGAGRGDGRRIAGDAARGQDGHDVADRGGLQAEDFEHLDAGVRRRPQEPDDGERQRDGHGQDPLRRVSRDPGLHLAVRQAGGREHHVEAGEADRGERAGEQGGPVGRVEQPVPEAAGREPRAGRQHEGEDAVDDGQAEPRGAEIDPPDALMGGRVEAIPPVVVDHRRRDLDDEERPLDGPGPDEDVDERRSGLRVDEADGEPDADAGRGAEDQRQQGEHPAQPAQVAEHPVVAFPPGLPLGHHEEQAAADGEMRDEDVQDRDARDQETGSGKGPQGVVHRSLPGRRRSCQWSVASDQLPVTSKSRVIH